MTRHATRLLQTLIVLTGIVVLVLMLWEPHLEGRNAHATTFEIYFKDPFLAYAYAASIAFFVALYQAFRLVTSIGRGEVYSQNSVRALRTIRYCAIALAAMVASAVAYLMIAVRGEDDIAGGVAMGVVMILVSIAGATTAGLLERRVAERVSSPDA